MVTRMSLVDLRGSSSHTSSLPSAWRLLAVWCDEAVYIAVQKAQGQRNMILLRCASVSLTESFAGQSVWSTSLRTQAYKHCNIKLVKLRPYLHSVIYGLAFMRVCLHCSVGADKWMCAVSAVGCLQTPRPLFEGLSLTVHPACLLPSFCVCPLIKRLLLPVTLPDCVFTVQLTLKSCVNMQSVFPSD